MKIYIAGPYSKGDVAINVGVAIQYADDVIRLGHTPYIPHLTHFWHMLSPKPYDFWLEYDNEWLQECDALLRISGESNGADKEEELARRLGLPIYYSVKEIPE